MRSLLLFLLVAAWPVAAQQWVQISDGLSEAYEPRIQALHRAPDGSVWAGTSDDGLYRSENEGETWESIDAPFSTSGVLSIADAPGGGLYVATTIGLFRGDGSGAWHLKDLPSDYIVSLAASRTVLLAGEGYQFPARVFRSVDGGETWEEALQVDLSGVVTILPDGAAYVGSRDALYRSKDGGVAWEKVDSSRTTTERVYPAFGSLYVAGSDGIYRSDDGGDSWEPSAFTGEQMRGLFSAEEERLYANVGYSYSEGPGVYVTTDGESWARFDGPYESGFGGSRIVLASVGESTRTLVGTYRDGVYVQEEDDGGGWSWVNSGFEKNREIHSFAQVGSRIIANAAVAGSGGAVLYERSHEGAWEPLPAEGLLGEAWSRVTDVEVVGDSTLLAAVDEGLYSLSPSESVWVNTSIPRSPLSLMLTPSGAVVAGGAVENPFGYTGETYRSTDNAQTWSLPSPLPGPVEDLRASPGGVLYVGMRGTFEVGMGGVYRSDDDGLSWSPTGLVGPYINSVLPLANGEVFAGIRPGVPTESGVFRSVDGGATWEPTAYAGTYTQDLAADDAGSVYAARLMRDRKDGVYKTEDGGGTWTLITDGLTARRVQGLYVDRSGYLYAGTSHGVFRTAEPLPVSTAPEAPPLAFALGAAYPNPASGVMTLPFTLAESAEATVIVRDVLGREVTIALDATLPAGDHAARWDARGVSAGVYAVTLHVDGRTATQRVTVAR